MGQHDEPRGSQGVKGGGQSQEGIQGGRRKAGSRGGGVWAQSIDIGDVVWGMPRAEDLQEARGMRRNAADPDREAMMPFMDVTLDHKSNRTSKRQMPSTWASGARPCTRSTSATSPGAECCTTGGCACCTVRPARAGGTVRSACLPPGAARSVLRDIFNGLGVEIESPVQTSICARGNWL